MLQDLRFSLRTLAANPGFTAVAGTALALGIGANATVFSLANALLFKNLPFTDSERVLYLTSLNPKNPRGNDSISYPDFTDLRAQTRSFQTLGASSRSRSNLSDDVNAPDTYGTARVTSTAFSAVGQSPVLGRAFLPEDEKPGAPPVAVLTWSLWERRYGKDPAIVGRKIRVDSVPTTVIGVMAKNFSFPTDTDLWQPFVPSGKEKRQDRFLLVFGRLSPGITRDGAQAEISTLAQRLAGQYPETNRDIRVILRNFQEISIRGQVRTVFIVLLGAVGFVLLIACANVANLLLSRAVGRAREISIRTALGAGRWRVVRQLLAESLLLSFAGGAIGWLIAIWGIRTFDAAVIPTGKPLWIDFSMDYRALAYLAAITIATAILFGLVPALRLSRLDVNSALKDGGRGGAGLRGKYLSGVLVVVEMTLAVVLLAGAGVMMRSFLKAYSRPTGVDTAGILTMRVDLPSAKYPKPADQLAFQRDLLARLRALPGVESATLASTLRGSGNLNFNYELEGQPADPQKRPTTNFLTVAEGYFETLRLAARRGRVFTAADHLPGANVAILNDTMAQRAWPNQDPIGRRFRIVKNNVPGEWITIVGLIPDVLQNSQQADPEPAISIPSHLEPLPSMSVLARTHLNPASLGQAFRHEVQAVDRDLPVRDVLTLDETLALNRWPLRVFGAMFAIFAAIALLLATVGLYAVVAYGVNQRTREIGVRVALGASAGTILRMVFATGMRQVVAGLVLGLAAAFGVTRVLTTFLIGVSPTDPPTFTAVSLLLIAAATLGCAIPARRAMRVDPAIALRHE